MRRVRALPAVRGRPVPGPRPAPPDWGSWPAGGVGGRSAPRPPSGSRASQQQAHIWRPGAQTPCNSHAPCLQLLIQQLARQASLHAQQERRCLPFKGFSSLSMSPPGTPLLAYHQGPVGVALIPRSPAGARPFVALPESGHTVGQFSPTPACRAPMPCAVCSVGTNLTGAASNN